MERTPLLTTCWCGHLLLEHNEFDGRCEECRCQHFEQDDDDEDEDTMDLFGTIQDPDETSSIEDV
jgi:hypothetical protein